MSKTFSLFTQPYLDPYDKCYKNIVTVNLYPQGPLQNLITQVKLNILSPFKQRLGVKNCEIALLSLECRKNTNMRKLMTPDEIPDLFSYLMSCGYTIDTKITNMLNKSDIRFNTNKSKTLVSFVTYCGN
jgi:hypothetical protein